MRTALDMYKILGDFAASLEAMGLSEHMQAARGFARDGVSADELFMLMRGNFPKPVIAALIVEARDAASHRVPVIE